MVFWIIILFALLFAYMGFKKGFYAMFATLFNLMFAIFISILSAPTVMRMTPGYENNGYYAAACIFMMFLLVFGFLQGVSWFYLLRSGDKYFPDILEIVGSPILGFLCGYVLASLILFSVSIMPIKADPIPLLGSRDYLQQLSHPGIVKVCNFLGEYSLECFYGEVDETLDTLIHINEIETEEPIQMYIPKGTPSERSEDLTDEIQDLGQ